MIATSALEGIGLAAFDAYRSQHRTLAFVGSSGAGRSTLRDSPGRAASLEIAQQVVARVEKRRGG